MRLARLIRTWRRRAPLVPNSIPPHGLDAETRQSVVELLNARLADAIDLELQAKQAHWNVKGPNFIGLHELFDKVAAAGREVQGRDRRAGRDARRRRRGHGPGRRRADDAGALPGRGAGLEEPRRLRVVGAGQVRHGAAQAIEDADELEDAVTADLFTEIAHEVDKYMWFVEAPPESDDGSGPRIRRASGCAMSRASRRPSGPLGERSLLRRRERALLPGAVIDDLVRAVRLHVDAHHVAGIRRLLEIGDQIRRRVVVRAGRHVAVQLIQRLQ